MIELRTICGWKALVHKTLLCHYSTYYDAAIYGKFQEANIDHFDIGLDKSCAEWFVRWLYSGKLSGPDANTGTEELFRLYVFADEKDILALRRDVMTRLMEFDSALPYSEIALPINSLPPSAPLYKFIVEWHSHHWWPVKRDFGPQDQGYEDLPKEFLHLVMRGLVLRPGSNSNSIGTNPSCACCGSPCRFHEHKSYEEWQQSELIDPFSCQS